MSGAAHVDTVQQVHHAHADLVDDQQVEAAGSGGSFRGNRRRWPLPRRCPAGKSESTTGRRSGWSYPALMILRRRNMPRLALLYFVQKVVLLVPALLC